MFLSNGGALNLRRRNVLEQSLVVRLQIFLGKAGLSVHRLRVDEPRAFRAGALETSPFRRDRGDVMLDTLNTRHTSALNIGASDLIVGFVNIAKANDARLSVHVGA